MTITRNRFVAALLAIALVLVALVGVNSLQAAPAQAASPSIPACVNDDYNDGTQAICYTVRTDGQYILINRSDVVVADMSSERQLKQCDYYGYVGHWCISPSGASKSGYLVQSHNGTKYYVPKG